MKIYEFIREDGSSPYRDWFDHLNAQDAAKVTAARFRLELGNITHFKWFDEIGEFHVDCGAGYNLYLVQDGLVLVVLMADTVSNKLESIDNARELYSEYKFSRYRKWA